MPQAGDKFLCTLTIVKQMDTSGDAHPEHPIVIPPPVLPGSDPHPEHPIVLPPEPMPPLQPVYPAHPIIIPGVPAHPIVIPPDEPTTPDTPSGNWGWVYIPGEGWKQAWFPALGVTPSK